MAMAKIRKLIGITKIKERIAKVPPTNVNRSNTAAVEEMGTNSRARTHAYRHAQAKRSIKNIAMSDLFVGISIDLLTLYMSGILINNTRK